MPVLLQSTIAEFPVRRGKVRDVYDLGDRLLIVASDRISAFDVIMPTGIPDKGRLLTRLSNFWFAHFSGEVRHHLLATELIDFPPVLRAYGAQLRGRSVIVKKTRVVPIECVVRGYLAGGGWKDYQQTGAILDVKLPPGLRQCDKLPEPVFTPTTKADAGHDAPITFADAAGQFGRPLLETLRDRSIALYREAAAYAADRGIILADTKFEWGLEAGSGDPILIDEILTPDSSRFWPAAGYEAGRDQPSYDKQFVRNFLETLVAGGLWHKTPPGPELPAGIVEQTRVKYMEAYERLTGERFE